MKNPFKNNKKAFKIIIFFGLVSLLGDIIYEGARSINGQYLQILGANAAIVGLIAGLGEFIGYSLRFISGYFSDKTKAYWFFTILGYGLLISIPLLALTGLWQIAAFLIIIERIGKAVRNPARDTLMSQAAKDVGTGLGFAIHEFLDQIGALLGPILISLLFLILNNHFKDLIKYQYSYAILWIPYLLLMSILFIAYFSSKTSQKSSIEKSKIKEKLSSVFWSYVIFTFLTTLGFVNFLILGYHFKATHLLSDTQIPLFYAIAMIVDAIFALIIGKAYDLLKTKTRNENSGLLLLVIIPILTAFIPLFVFLNNFYFIILGVILWGIIMGTHETIMRAAIADITPLNKRGTGYGIFTGIYGLAALLGGTITGILYDYSLYWLIFFIVITQLLSILSFLFMRKKINKL